LFNGLVQKSEQGVAAKAVVVETGESELLARD
jgi:hypothetical protein